MIFSSLYLDLVGYVLFICVFIPVWVFVVLMFQFFSFSDTGKLSSEDDVVELVWTVVPTFLVVWLCYLNFQCLGYEAYRRTTSVFKVVGHQWFWSYEPVDSGSYDSLMLCFIDSVDKPLRLSYNVPVCLFVTSADVIHSFALPSFSLKMDCVPGRINQIMFCPDRVGVFIGYCSELCGAGHGYMPIVAEVVVCK